MSDLPNLDAARTALAKWANFCGGDNPPEPDPWMLRDALAAVDALTARLAEAEATLAPFAAFADTFTSAAPDSQIVAEWGTPTTPVLITVGSLRAAKRATMKAADAAKVTP